MCNFQIKIIAQPFFQNMIVLTARFDSCHSLRNGARLSVRELNGSRRPENFTGVAISEFEPAFLHFFG
jgi:hypothetical protein